MTEPEPGTMTTVMYLVSQAARISGFSENSIRGWIRYGSVRATRLCDGAPLLLDAATVAELISRRTVYEKTKQAAARQAAARAVKAAQSQKEQV